MEMPKPSEHHRKLQALVGEWVGTDTFAPVPWMPQGATASVRISSRLDLDGFYVLTDWVQERDGKVSFRGHGVFGYDALKQQYTMHWFDVMGVDPGPPALGTWNGDTLVFTHQHAMGHGRYTFGFPNMDTYTFTLERSDDGKVWTRFLEGRYHRA